MEGSVEPEHSKGGDMLDLIQRREQIIRRIRKLPDVAMSRIEEVVVELEQARSELPKVFAHDNAVQRDEGRSCLMEGCVEPQHSRVWPHAPIHKLSEHGTYIVTAGTLHKLHLFRGDERLDLLEAKLLELAEQYGWQLEAWAVFSNHYHFIAHAGSTARKLQDLLSHLHTATATAINELDRECERQVWHNFWDTELTIETSYLARLHYVHTNAVKHGLVKVANQYRWCSAAWFERTATPAQVKTIYSFGLSRVRVFDDF